MAPTPKPNYPAMYRTAVFRSRREGRLRALQYGESRKIGSPAVAGGRRGREPGGFLVAAAVRGKLHDIGIPSCAQIDDARLFRRDGKEVPLFGIDPNDLAGG